MACFFLHLRLGSHPSNCDVEIPYDTDTSTFLQTTTVQNRRKVQKVGTIDKLGIDGVVR